MTPTGISERNRGKYPWVLLGERINCRELLTQIKTNDTAVLVFVSLLALLWRFHYRNDFYLSYFTDDFFYYVEVARQLVVHHISSFNGFQLTNGYHPLWLVVLTCIFSICRAHKSFFVVTIFVIWLLLSGCLKFIRDIQSLQTAMSSVNRATAAYAFAFMAVISRTGMEVALALFFLFLFWRRMFLRPLEDQTPQQAFYSGVIASLLIFSRIDCVLVIILYCALMLVTSSQPRRQVGRSLAFFSSGLLLVVAYLVLNQVIFHSMLPISGLAKNLKATWFPSISTLRRLSYVDGINLIFTWPVLAVLAAYLVVFRGKVASTRERVRICIALHPIVFYVVLSFTSDWHLWTWYLYPLVPVAAIIGPCVLSPWFVRRREHLADGLYVGVGLLSLGVLVSLALPNKDSVRIYDAAKVLQTFATTHPGRYAMGDRSGTAAFLMQQPVLQLEGLMGDKPFLERIRRRQALMPVLKDYNVDYYVNSSATAKGSCYEVVEPEKAGPSSPTMRDELCSKPLFTFQFGIVRTMIFDLRDNSRR